MLPFCLDQGVGVLPYSPLARGLLARARATGDDTPTARAVDEATSPLRQTDCDNAVVDALHAIATNRAVAPARIALGWVLSKPAVSAPIVGATKPEHLDDALAAVELSLSDEETARLEAGYRPHTPFGYS
jgi:aryl-alcohol dehydrogenase-like predicted oxidoreductase